MRVDRFLRCRTAHGHDRARALCVGIDPHPGLLAHWGLDQSLEGLVTFANTCVEAFTGTVAVVKPQSAFFERFGSAGVAVLERTLAGLREGGTLSLLDVKRGDIGSTMSAYAEAYLSHDSPLPAAAIPVTPFLGLGSLRPAPDSAAARAPASPSLVAFRARGQPNRAEAAADIAAEDVIRIRVVPLFVGRGRHLREDFPRQLDAARAAAPSVEFEVTEAAGENDSVLNALAAFAVIELGALSIYKVTH